MFISVMNVGVYNYTLQELLSLVKLAGRGEWNVTRAHPVAAATNMVERVLEVRIDDFVFPNQSGMRSWWKVKWLGS